MNAVDTHSFGQAELQLQWMLLDFGRRAGRHGQAVARQRVAELRLTRAGQTVALDTCTAYLQVLLTSALRVVRASAIQAAEATLRDTKARRAAGAAERDDVLRAEVQLSETREALVIARDAELAALARLNNVLGRNASLPLRVHDWRAQPDFSLSLVECLEAAAARRPEVGVVREEVAAAVHGRDVAEAAYLPRVYLRSTVGEVGGANVLEGTQAGLGIHIEQGIYEGGRRRGEVRAGEADVKAALAAAQAILDGISLEVTLAHRALGASRRRIDLAEPAISQATENLRLVRVKYRNGNATPTDVVDAETTLTRSQQRYYAAVYEYLSALARLEYALGGSPGTLLRACFDDGPGQFP
jgi:outer membrane protein TolC